MSDTETTSTVSTLYIDFDAFFANVEKQLDPSLHALPVLVCPMDTPRSGVIACCYEAKAFGVKRGMSRQEVNKIAPNGVFRPARHEIYVEIHHKIIDVIETFIPVRRSWSIDEMECDLGTMDGKAALTLAENIRDALSDVIGPLITPSIGIASNQLLAKIGAEMNKPRGLELLEPRFMPEKIHKVPLKDVPGIADGMLHRLQLANVTTLPHLLALAPKQARAIWGSVEGERMWRALHGEHVVKPETKRGMFGHSRVLARDWQDPVKAHECLRLLTTKAARRLRKEAYYATKLTVSFKDFHGGKFKIEREFSALRDDYSFLRIMAEAFDSLISSSRIKRLKHVAIFLHGLQKHAQLSGDLFSKPEDTARQETVSEIMDVLNEKFGGEMLHLGKRVELPGGYAGGKIAFGRIPTRAELGLSAPQQSNWLERLELDAESEGIPTQRPSQKRHQPGFPPMANRC